MSATDFVRNHVPTHKTYRVAIAGTAWAGKTVFLTSLLNHLQEHDSGAFFINKGARITNFEHVMTPSGNGTDFPYPTNRKALTENHSWPAKTCDSTHYTCEFRRSDRRRQKVTMHFFDFPGERVADAAIGHYKSYADWCDHVIATLEHNSDYHRPADEFFAAMSQTQLVEADLVAAYKRALATYYANFQTFITPSTFVLDQHGQNLASRTHEELMLEQAARPCGLGTDEQGRPRDFVPLSLTARESHPQLAEVFERRYAEYRKQVVLPLYDHLGRCDSLVFLMDIPTLLTGGVQMFGDNRQILADLLRTMTHKSFFKNLFGHSRKLRRVAFVANKQDLVHPRDLRADKLTELLRQMVQKFQQNLGDGVRTSLHTCAPCISAYPTEGEHMMCGRLQDAINPNKEEMDYPVSPLPDGWPADWPPGHYQFPQVYPFVPANPMLAPNQQGLDKIFESITEN